MLALDDPFKRRILDALQREGRLTNQELAERVGLSASPCWRRVRELEEEGVIRRYVAILEPEKVDVGECVFTLVNLEMHNRDSLAAFEQAVKDRPEILECYAITGDADFILKVHVPNIRAYDRLLNEVLFRIPGMKHVKSSFTLREVKYDTALPLPEGERR
ncbi:MAG TPA: Lrp/AsnC family transcriptional regulator [Geminicoccaceae bacterium]|jgi:DNA-binding Lrp family transcriptional regulator|nr:Lrp/AsnC family transcriptional regulator [Geminicoccaceae bacterium]